MRRRTPYVQLCYACCCRVAKHRVDRGCRGARWRQRGHGDLRQPPVKQADCVSHVGQPCGRGAGKSNTEHLESQHRTSFKRAALLKSTQNIFQKRRPLVIRALRRTSTACAWARSIGNGPAFCQKCDSALRCLWRLPSVLCPPQRQAGVEGGQRTTLNTYHGHRRAMNH